MEGPYPSPVRGTPGSGAAGAACGDAARVGAPARPAPAVAQDRRAAARACDALRCRDARFDAAVAVPEPDDAVVSVVVVPPGYEPGYDPDWLPEPSPQAHAAPAPVSASIVVAATATSDRLAWFMVPPWEWT